MSQWASRLWASLTLLLVMGVAHAAIDTYTFSNEQNEQRFQHLTDEFRCPKCQNQNIADSDSPIASDLRREVHRMVEEGKSDQSIIDFMVTRYGEFVLYRPRIEKETWLLWFGPGALLVVGLVIVALVARHRRKRIAPQNSAQLSAEDSEQLKKLLDQDKRS